MMAGNAPATFDGKDKSADQNADMCLFMRNGKMREAQRYCMDQGTYEDWKDKTLAYYTSTGCRDRRTGKSRY